MSGYSKNRLIRQDIPYPVPISAPTSVLLQDSRANTLMWRARDEMLLRGLSRGRPRKVATYEKAPVLAVFVANSQIEIDVLLETWTQAIGQPVRGNKRLGRLRLYADLVQHYTELRRLGVTLPRGKSLSALACQYGLGDILRKHGCTRYSDAELIQSSSKRHIVATKMHSVFLCISNAVKSTPLKITKNSLTRR